MMNTRPWSTLLLAAFAVAQQAAVYTADVHPGLTTQKCTKSGGCVNQTSKVVLDANWRYLHSITSPSNCFSDPSWNATLCPDPVTCAKNCALEGVSVSDYYNKYGVSTSGPNLTLRLFPSSSIGSRVYLLSDDSHYQTINLANQEISFDVDVSGLPCGTNGALYLVNMAADGGQSAFANNKAGATYGTGYCDAQCRQDLHFINGEANLLNWNTNSRTGRYGSCCHEVDLWEANAASTAYTLHPCSILGQTRCDTSSTTCGTYCDPAGCDFNPYRMGNTSFYGLGKTIDANPGTMRVTTQFLTSDGTAKGQVNEMRRFYINRTPKGTLIPNAASNIAGVSGNSITDSYCTAEKKAFGESNTFASEGGMSSMSKGIELGMVLTMSIFVDYASGMRWLDSVFPDGSNAATPGDRRGSCSTSTGDPGTIQSTYPSAQVTFSNIKWGDLGSTIGPPYP